MMHEMRWEVPYMRRLGQLLGTFLICLVWVLVPACDQGSVETRNVGGPRKAAPTQTALATIEGELFVKLVRDTDVITGHRIILADPSITASSIELLRLPEQVDRQLRDSTFAYNLVEERYQRRNELLRNQARQQERLESARRLLMVSAAAYEDFRKEKAYNSFNFPRPSDGRIIILRKDSRHPSQIAFHNEACEFMLQELNRAQSSAASIDAELSRLSHELQAPEFANVDREYSAAKSELNALRQRRANIRKELIESMNKLPRATSTVTDSKGAFSFTVEPGTYVVMSAYLDELENILLMWHEEVRVAVGATTVKVILANANAILPVHEDRDK
jgi:hypothetical protein